MPVQTIGLKQWVLVFVVWLITQLITLWYSGIYIQEEALVYTNIASEIVGGNFNHSIHFLLYAGYILPLIFIKLIGLPFEWMYLLQLAVSFFGVFAFVNILKTIKVSRISIVAGSVLFASCPFFHAWNSHLYTDAFFGNIVVIYIYLLFRFAHGKSVDFLLLFLFLIFATFIRPVGFLLIIITLIYFLIFKLKRIKILVLAVWLLFTAIFINFSIRHGKDFFYPNHNLELNIICGLPGNLKKYEVNQFTEGMSIPAYFISNPNMTWRLFSGRLVKSLWMTRPYFSPTHNFINAFLCIFYYVPALFGIFHVIREKFRIGFYFISGMVIWLIPNVLFCADWHNRFMVPFLPFMIVLSSYGIEFLKSNTARNNIRPTADKE